MAAYAAAVSLENTIEHILESSRFSLVPPTPEILRQVDSQLYPLKEILERLDSRSKSKSRKKVNGLDEEMKEALWRFEDLLEHHLSQEILSQSGDALSLFSVDLWILQHDVDSFIETMEDLERKYTYELENMPQVEDDEWVSSRNDLDGVKMLPLFSDLYADAKRSLTNRGSQRVLYLCGMAGSGKTSLAKRLFDDAVEVFDHRVWVTVGRKSEFGAISRRVLAELDDKITELGDEEIGERLKERMKGKRCLVVLDDVWDTELLDSLWSSFPNDGTDAVIRILVTTKISNYDNLGFISTESTTTMRPLSAEESEDLLREKVFGEGDFPSHLKEAANKIAKSCRGLPLMIVIVADLLSNSANMSIQYWDDVAEKRNSVLRDASHEIAKVLSPVYDCFHQHLKMFFLYVGAFPKIVRSSLPSSYIC